MNKRLIFDNYKNKIIKLNNNKKIVNIIKYNNNNRRIIKE